MATPVETTVKDQSTSNLVPVEGLPVTETVSNPTTGQCFRQVAAIGDGGGGSASGNYANVTNNASWVQVYNSGGAIGPTNPAAVTAGQFSRTDHSGTITSGGTAQDVFATAAAVHGFYFQNLSTSAMYLRDDGTSASAGSGSILIAANGGYYESPVLSTPTSKLSVFCATTSAAFTSKVW